MKRRFGFVLLGILCLFVMAACTDKSKKDADKLRELVPIRLIKTKQEQGDLIVRVNGYAYQIQRGVVVNVPRFIKEVIDHKELLHSSLVFCATLLFHYPSHTAIFLGMQFHPNDKPYTEGNPDDDFKD